MKFAELVADLGDMRDFEKHDAALKFWLPEPAYEALNEVCGRGGESMSAMLRLFLAQHCYGVYAVEVMNDANPGLFRDPANTGGTRFSIRDDDEPEGKVRVITYWVPELGKNVVPVKVWIPARMRRDFGILSEHVGIKTSQYVREIVISRLLGHGTLPRRPEMLEATPLPSAEDWEDDKTVPMREASVTEYWASPEGKVTSELRDEDAFDS